MHSDSMIALASLDEIHRDDTLAHYNTQSGDAPNITSALEQVQAWIGEEESILDTLRGRLGT